MVDDESALEGIAGLPPSRWRHDWYPYDDYQNVHHGHIDGLTRAGTILDSRLSFFETVQDGLLIAVNLVGIILCADDVSIKVDKTLDVNRRPSGQVLVKGALYSYHAWLNLAPEQDLIRYCTAYGLADLHRHTFDLRTGVEAEQPRIAIDELPTLAEFIPQAVDLGRQAKELRP